MKKLLLLLLFPLYAWGQTTDANLKSVQIDPKIRNITTSSGITKGNVSDVLQAIVNSKVSRIEANSTSGTNTYTGTISWVTGYSFGLNFPVVFNTGNSGASTLNINTLGAVALKKNGSTALSSGDIQSGQVFWVFYDGINFQMIGGGGAVTPAALTKTDDTNVTLTLGGSPSTALLNATSLTLGWAGTLADGRIASASTWNAKVDPARNINTTSPLSGGGNLSADRILSIANAAADGSTLGAASFTAADFNSSSGNISLDYTNGQAASGSVKGFLNSVDWTTFNGKQAAITFGTGVQTALGVNIGSAGAPVLFNGAGGTPTSLVGTNITGTASGLTAGNVTTNANLTGPITSSGNVTSVAAQTGTGSTFVMSAGSPTLSTPVFTGLPTGSGVSSSATASTLAARDANINLLANNFVPNQTSVTTAAGTTTLTVSSAKEIYFTGSTTQDCILPVASTLTLGHTFKIHDNSTGQVTVKSSGGNTIAIMDANTVLDLECILTSGTGTASWDAAYIGSYPLTSVGDLFVGGTLTNTVPKPDRIAAGTLNQVLIGQGAATKPIWTTGVPGTATNDNATTGYVGETGSSKIAVGSATSLTTATAKNITSVSLAAGDYWVSGNVNFTESGATVTARSAGISTTSATLPTDGTEVPLDFNTTTATIKVGIALTSKRISLASTTTVYLVGSATFSAGTNSGYGSLNWVRIR